MSRVASFDCFSGPSITAPTDTPSKPHKQRLFGRDLEVNSQMCGDRADWEVHNHIVHIVPVFNLRLAPPGTRLVSQNAGSQAKACN